MPAALAAGLVMLALAAEPAAAAHRVLSPFNPTTPLPDGAGAVDPSLLVSPDGPVGILASSGPGEGCSLYTVSHTGGLAQYLGRLPGGSACALAGTEVKGAPQVAYTATSSATAVAGQSSNGGVSFTTAPVTVSGTGSLAADPAPGPTGTTDLYMLTPDPSTGAPRDAVSQDGGRSFTVGSSVVDPAQVPAALWSGPGPALVVGNLVARRTDAGLSLYAAFETSSSAADRSAQAAAHSDDLGRVYEAVGQVAPTVGGASAVVWKDTLLAVASPGMALNRALPSTAVDSAGTLYTTFSDGRHVYVTTSADGLTWSHPVAIDATAGGAPRDLTAAVLPAVVAGGAGAADVAWYAATGRRGTSADPLLSPDNTWNVLMAQTLDGGATWHISKVTTSPVHRGVLCVAADVGCAAQPMVVTYPDSALQVALDQVTGAAVLAFAADAQTPGDLSLLETRQCTGQNALTGAPVVDDCVAMQPATPVLPGTSCPGPQITDSAGDAIATGPGMGGGNLPALDLLTVHLGPDAPGDDVARIDVNRMSRSLPAGVSAATWRVMWTLGTVRYYAEATSRGGGTFAYSVGRLGAGDTPVTAMTVPGAVTTGAGGGVLIHIPRRLIGNVAQGTLAQDIEAATFAAFTGTTQTLGQQLVDRAPNGGFGAAYAFGSVCPPATDLPEAPLAPLLPAAGAIAGMLTLVVRRRRAGRRGPEMVEVP